MKRQILFLAAGIVTCAFSLSASGQAKSDVADPHMVAMAGTKLSAPEAEALEKTLAENPQDLEARTKLLGYHSQQFGDKEAAKRQTAHALWIIANRPGAAIAGLPYAQIDAILQPEAYAEGRKLWLKAVEQHGEDAKIVYNAAKFFLLPDRETAERLFLKGEALEPQNPRWPKELGHLYEMNSHKRTGEVDRKVAAQSLAAYERAVQKTAEERRGSLETAAARAAVFVGETGKARDYAARALKRAEQNRSWDYGNVIHQGNLVLGQLELRAGEIEEAEKYLLEAGKTPGSPQLNSFGPNMYLALELLKKARTKAVLEYLDLCGSFWDRERIELWSKEIESGKTPDFGANLWY